MKPFSVSKWWEWSGRYPWLKDMLELCINLNPFKDVSHSPGPCYFFTPTGTSIFPGCPSTLNEINCRRRRQRLLSPHRDRRVSIKGRDWTNGQRFLTGFHCGNFTLNKRGDKIYCGPTYSQKCCLCWSSSLRSFVSPFVPSKRRRRHTHRRVVTFDSKG